MQVSVARGWHRAGSAAPAVQTLLPRCYAGAEGVEGADTSRTELLVSRRYTNTLGAVACLFLTVYMRGLLPVLYGYLHACMRWQGSSPELNEAAFKSELTKAVRCKLLPSRDSQSTSHTSSRVGWCIICVCVCVCVRVRVEIMGSQKLWSRGGISVVSAGYDQSHYRHPHHP
jgi:hypothetical protein